MEIVIEDLGNDSESAVVTPRNYGITEGDGWTIFVGGTFNSATAQVQVSPKEAGPFASPTELEFTDNGFAITNITPSVFLKLVNDDAGDGSTAISLWLDQAS